MSLSSVFKELYRGHGIYWHGLDGYGDETNAWTRTMGEYKAKIDARIAEELARPVPAHEVYFGSLSPAEQRLWRQRMEWESGYPVSYQAYAEHLGVTCEQLEGRGLHR